MRSKNHPLARHAYAMCKGVGLEIGPLHMPFELDAKVYYLDAFSSADLREMYKSAPYVEDIVNVHFISKGMPYTFFGDNIFDFVLNCHVLEHMPNPGIAIQEWLRIVHKGGVLYMIVPDKNYCFDKPRALTPVSHLMHEYENRTLAVGLDHYCDFFFEKEDGLPTTQENILYVGSQYEQQASIHAHTFDKDTLKEFLVQLQAALPFEITFYSPEHLHIHVCLTKK